MLDFNLDGLEQDLLAISTTQNLRGSGRYVLLPTNENDPAFPLQPNARGKARVNAAVAHAEAHNLGIFITGGWYNPLGHSMALIMAIDIFLRHGRKAAARILGICDLGVTTLLNVHGTVQHFPDLLTAGTILDMASEGPHHGRIVPVAAVHGIQLELVPSGADGAIYNAKDDAAALLNANDPWGRNVLAQAFAEQAKHDWVKSAINNFWIWWVRDPEKAIELLETYLPVFQAFVAYARKQGILVEAPVEDQVPTFTNLQDLVTGFPTKFLPESV